MIWESIQYHTHAVNHARNHTYLQLRYVLMQLFTCLLALYTYSTDYGRPVRKSPSLQGQKSNPKFLGTAEAYFVCHIGEKFLISLIHAFIGCP